MAHVARIALAAAFLIACNGPVAGAPATGTPSPWRDRGEQMCRAGVTPDTDPPCGAAVLDGVAVWSNGAVISLRSALASTIVVGVDPAAILRCDLARFPLPSSCMARTTCPGADVVVMAAYVRGVMIEYRERGCW